MNFIPITNLFIAIIIRESTKNFHANAAILNGFSFGIFGISASKSLILVEMLSRTSDKVKVSTKWYYLLIVKCELCASVLYAIGVSEKCLVYMACTRTHTHNTGISSTHTKHATLPSGKHSKFLFMSISGSVFSWGTMTRFIIFK